MVHAAALEADQLNTVGEKLHTLVHSGDLDREKLHTLVHTGDLDTVQLVHSYNLPPPLRRSRLLWSNSCSRLLDSIRLLLIFLYQSQ